MTELEYLAIGYAFFIFLIVLESAVSIRRRDGRYRLHETIGNIGHGVVYQTFDYYTKAFVMVPFLLVSAHFSVFELPMDAVWGWVVGILIYDLVSYWAHRHGHEINAMWAVHAVHHAAEDYNLAAALRQPLFSHLYYWAYRLPLALFMPVEMFVVAVVFDYIYQFVQHTQYVPKLGPLGWLMNTPSHHRVHHGTNEKYLDKNYGGIFIIWDRLFGTFQAEEEAVNFGITKPVGTLDPIWGNLVFWNRLIAATGRAPDLRTKVAVWLKGPGDLDALVPPIPAPPQRSPAVSQPPSRRTMAYVLTNAMISLPALPALIYFGEQWGVAVQVVLAVFILVSTTMLVALLEGRRWAWRLEPVRALALAVGLLWLLPASYQALQDRLVFPDVTADVTDREAPYSLP